MKKSAVFIWEKDQQEAFQQAKQALLNAVTLQHPSPTAQVQLNTDASGTHIGAALMQRENEQQPWAPIEFYSKGLNAAQKKYSTYDHELLAAFLACKKYKHFLAKYIWPGLGQDIKKFVRSCPVCQGVKINKHEHVKSSQSVFR